jgi:plasmid maintenance system antidote protein VapI
MAKKLLDPIPPGEILLEEFMRPLGVSIKRLARDIAVPPNRINGIVNGKCSITADTAPGSPSISGHPPRLGLTCSPITTCE